ncbi:uncharacterized protein si:dkey-182g1.6 [Danio rerio]|uniref:Uncharacterized protein si:dkey-182g1.6 n=1 Tax=Danio rerio TaxID=7955 RepID=A0AC58IGT7_DANRE
MTNHSLLLWLLLFLDGASGAVEVSVIKGDSVTLQTGVSELQNDNKVDWTHGDGTIVAEIENKEIKTKDPAKLFKGRLEIDRKTGSLTIINITTEDKGFYKLDIRGKDLISKNFNVTVRGSAKRVSVKEGESVTLHTGVTDKQRYDQILWRFKDQDIAEINKGKNHVLVHDRNEEKNTIRFQLNENSGSLTISDSKSIDSGDYHLNMTSSTHSIWRTFSVNVKTIEKMDNQTPGLHPGYIALIVVCVLIVLPLAAAVIYFCNKEHEII